jgi:hypothetical protein
VLFAAGTNEVHADHSNLRVTGRLYCSWKKKCRFLEMMLTVTVDARTISNLQNQAVLVQNEIEGKSAFVGSSIDVRKRDWQNLSIDLNDLIQGQIGGEKSSDRFALYQS